jgi:cyanophycinase-like exopeptidase
MATVRVDDPDRTIWLAHDLGRASSYDAQGTTVLLQIGRASAVAIDLGQRLEKLGRRPVALIVKDREQAQSEASIARVSNANAIWIFADDLFEAFLTIFATSLAFELRQKARDGVPIIGIGPGALALGGLMLANRICRDAQYDLIGGLGWAPRVLVDGGADRDSDDGAIARDAVRTLPGLLGLDLGAAGGVTVRGGRIESIGSEPIQLIGAGENGAVLMMSLEPGKVTAIAPPPFAPFERGLLPPHTLSSLVQDSRASQAAALRRAPSDVAEGHALPGSGQRCPMCRQFHEAKPKAKSA